MCCVPIHRTNSRLNVGQRRSRVHSPDHTQPPCSGAKRLDAFEDMRVHLIWRAEHSNILSVNVQIDKHFPLGKAADVVEPIDQILRVEVGDTALDQIRDDNIRLLRHFGKPDDYWGDLSGYS